MPRGRTRASLLPPGWSSRPCSHTALARGHDLYSRPMDRIDAAVIGAGPGGRAAAAMLKACGIETVVLEREAKVGASWHKHYDRLHLHTVRWPSHLPGLRLSRRRRRW